MKEIRRLDAARARAKDPEKFRARAREQYARNREFWKAKSRAYNALHKEERREYNKKNRDRAYLRFISRKYGLTSERYNQILLEQDGVCAICKGPPTNKNGRYVVDHCHSSLKVRGLLCDTCNAGLGMFRDSMSIAESAIEYLKRNG